MNIDVSKSKKSYRTAGRCDYQKQYKDILEAEIVSTPEVFTNNIPMPPIKSVTVKNYIARQSLHPFSEALGVKP